MISKNLFVQGKLDYVRGKRPQVRCILCAIVKKDKKVEDLELFRSNFFVVSLNLYPYNVGHLLIFPKRHIVNPSKLKDKEVLELHQLTNTSLRLLKEAYSPCGFNIGYNLGRHSGASISHLHLHIVPRYKNELGFMDVLSGSKIVVEYPSVTREKLKKLYEILC